ncbi:Uncharacterised protein r2_g2511 [Pycnogonum litorale]
MLDGLAFLPIDDVADGMTHLREIVPDYAEELVEYFDRTYVNGSVRHAAPAGDNRLRFRRMPPLFSPAIWNVHDAKIADEPRTNNICEAWNFKFSHVVGHKHPSIWRLLDAFKKEEGTVNVVRAQFDVGVQERPKKKPACVAMQPRLKNICQQHVAGNRTLEDTLRNIRFYR